MDKSRGKILKWVLPQRMRNPTLKFSILTIFVCILIVSSLSIIIFTYSRNEKSTLKLARSYFDQVSSSIVDKISSLIAEAEDLVRISSALIYNRSDFSFENKELIHYMVAATRYHPYIYGIYFADPKGSLLEVVNLAAAYQTNFIYTPDKPLPEKSAIVLRMINRSASPVYDRWEYLDANLNTLAVENHLIGPTDKTTNPIQRPWYLGALKEDGAIFWSDIYHFDPLKESGITVSKEIKDPSGTPIGAIGVDISLLLFSEFLTKKRFENSEAYVLDTQGKVIIPDTHSEKPNLAYATFAKEKKKDFTFKDEGITYVGLADVFPATTKYNWVILLFAPITDFLGDAIITQREVLIVSLVILLFAILIITYFSEKISKPIVTLAHETDRIRALDFSNEERVDSIIVEIQILDTAVAALRHAMHSFSRYIPIDVVKDLMAKEGAIILGGEKRKVVIFFSDIERFTTIMESLPAEVIMPQLAEYFDLLSKIILKRHGTIDKYIGDSIMAFWGAPREIPNPEEEACRAALECRDALVALNQQRAAEGKPLFKTRFGISSGEVIVGNIGTLERLNYTVMGDSVNTAARLQTANKIYHTDILISEKVNQVIETKFKTQLIDQVELKGKKEKVAVYTLS